MENFDYKAQRLEYYQEVIGRLFYYPFDKKEKNKIQTANVTFQVTDACNLCCSYCYQINKKHHVMPLKVAKQFIDLLLEDSPKIYNYIDTRNSQAIIIEFIGGEPFLEIELIDQIMDYFIKRMIETNHPWQYNWEISISSNGTLYFLPKVQDFIKKYKNHLSLSISIDGNKQLHDTCRVFPDGSGSYDKAISAVHHYVNVLKGDMGSKMTLSPQNVQYTYDAIKNLINEGYTDINFNCVFEKGWTYDHATIFYHQLILLADYIINNNLENQIYLSIFDENFFHPKELNDLDNWCGGTGTMIAIDWKGDIYPCIRYMESSLGDQIDPVIIGNIEDGVMITDKCKICVETLRSVTRLNQSSQECINCPIAEGCSWCSALNYQESGNFFHRETNICCMHKARALANFYFWNKIYEKYNKKLYFKLWLSDDEALKIINLKELNELKQINCQNNIT